jgi:hypothetical protein
MVCPSFTLIEATAFLGIIGLSVPGAASKLEVTIAVTSKPKILFVIMFVLNGANVKMVTLSVQLAVIFDKSGKNGILLRSIRK